MALTPVFYSLVAPGSNVKDGGSIQSMDAPTATQLENGTANPIFNFDQNFINNLQAVSTVEMGQSVPYIRLRTINHATGKIINDLSVEFFHKTLDMNTIKDPTRFSDRPEMSLKELTVTTDLSAGYLYFTKVDLRLRLHNPEKLQDNTLLAFLVPGAPLLLEYGWNSPNPFLNRKSNLLWQVKTYNLNFDATGQVDVHVEGMAFNETFNNIYIGDDGKGIEIKQPLQDDIKATPGEEKPEEIQFSNLNRIKKRLDKMTEFLEENKTNRKKVANYGIVKNNAEVLQKLERRLRKGLVKKFAQQKSKLKGKAYDEKKWGKGPVSCWTFHDLLWNLCFDTFEAMTSVFHPSTEATKESPDIKKDAPEFRIIYGTFNPNAGLWKNKSIADFPISTKRFNNLLRKQRKNGQIVPTVGGLFNMLISNFFENPEYHMSFLPKAERSEFKKPDIVVNVSNRGNVIEVQILDINQDFPITTSKFTKENIKPNDVLKSIIADKKVPVIFLGNAGSFIKNLSMSQISDQYMKAVLIERMNRDRINDLRSTVLPSQGLGESTVTPLTLPLRGNMNVLGHPEWKPFRAFFLSAGIYLIDGVYKILKVSHKLNSEGFGTNIDFMYH